MRSGLSRTPSAGVFDRLERAGQQAGQQGSTTEGTENHGDARRSPPGSVAGCRIVDCPHRSHRLHATLGSNRSARCGALTPHCHGGRRPAIHALHRWSQERRGWRHCGHHAGIGQTRPTWCGLVWASPNDSVRPLFDWPSRLKVLRTKRLIFPLRLLPWFSASSVLKICWRADKRPPRSQPARHTIRPTNDCDSDRFDHQGDRAR